HLNSCPACSGLLRDLSTIASQAKLLAAVDEPSPAVWNALEARLRSEGLIRRSEPIYQPLRTSIWQRWRASLLVPVAAEWAIFAVVKLFRPAGVGNDPSVAKQVPAVVQQTASKGKARAPLSRDDQQWLKTVANRPPAQLAKFQADLDQANAFI